MESNNSEKTGRLTPGQIDAVVRISGEIAETRDLIKKLREDRCVHVFCDHQSTDKEVIYYQTDYMEVYNHEIFSMIENYYDKRRASLESELAAVISGEGGAE